MRTRGGLVLALLLAPAGPATAGAKVDPRTELCHTVATGETLGGIANRAEVPRILIIEANGLKPPYAVREGQDLIIPRRRAHTVQPGETGFAIAMDYGVPWSAIALANGLKAAARVRAGQKLVIPTIARPPVREDSDEAEPVRARSAAAPFAWPAPGKVRRGFVLRAKGRGSSESRSTTSPHDGIDIAGSEGDPVRAAAPGKVWFAGKEPNLYGNVVILDHGHGWMSAYAKLSRVTVKKGETVRTGERVGLIGNTGSTSTTELHFEIRHRTVPQNPVELLPKR
ncbi:MAG TPA: M23 family metallopeptidase [Novosphingobium sp.]